MIEKAENKRQREAEVGPFKKTRHAKNPKEVPTLSEGNQRMTMTSRLFRKPNVSTKLLLIFHWLRIQLSQSLIGYDQCDQMLELKVAQFCTKFAQKESIFFIKREFF